jgi:hypothetical protein
MLHKISVRKLSVLFRVYECYKLFDINDRLEDFIKSKTYFIENKTSIEIEIIFRGYIFNHYASYFNLYNQFVIKEDIHYVFLISRVMKVENEDDILYLYGLYKLTKSEIDGIQPNPSNIIDLNNSLIEMKLFYKVRFDNFKSLLFLKYVKQVKRRLYIDPNLVVLFYQKITKSLL